jgi:hypothetical protein
MNKLLLLLFFLMLSFNSFAEWTELLVDDEEVLYIDLETLQEKSDGYVYFWLMRTYRTWKTKSFMQIDCEFNKMNALQNDIYYEDILKSSDGEKGWSYVAPDEYAYRNLKVICEMVNESPEQREKSIENFKMSFEYKNKINDLYEQEKQKNDEIYLSDLTDEEVIDMLLAKSMEMEVLKSAYTRSISEKVKANWRYQGAEDDWTAEVYVVQDRDGTVVAVDVRNANVDDSSRAKAFKDSIRRAVYKASPLPSAPDEYVFDRELIITFSVK